MPATDVHDQWIRDISGGQFDPAAHAARAQASKPSSVASADNPATVQEAGGPSPQAGAGSQRAINVAALVKAKDAWLATRQKMESDIAKLRSSFADTFKGHEEADVLTAGFEAAVESVMIELDEELAHRLADVVNTDDPTEHAKVAADAKKIIQRYEAFLASDSTIAEIDSNPLVPLAIQKMLTATLKVLNQVIV